MEVLKDFVKVMRRPSMLPTGLPLFFAAYLLSFIIFLPHAFAGTVTLGSDIKATTLTVDTGDTFDLDGYEMDHGTGAFTINGALDAGTGSESGDTNSTINVEGSMTIASASTFTNTGSTVTFDGASGTINITSGGKAFNNLTLNDGGGTAAFELQDALDVNGNLTITGGTLDTKLGTNNSINVAGNWSNADLFTARSGTVTFDGASATILSGTSEDAFYNVQIGDGVAALTKTIDTTLDVDNNLTIAANATLDTKLDENNQINVAATWTNNGAFTPRTSTVIFDGASSTILSGSSEDAFYNVQIGDGVATLTKTIDTTLDVDNNLTIAANATLDTKLNENNQINVAATWTNNGAFTPRTSTVIFDGASSSILSGNSEDAFYNVQIGDGVAALTKTIDAALDVNNNLTISANATLDTKLNVNNQINVGVNWSNSGTFTRRSGTVVFDGSGTSQITAGTTFNNFTCTTAGKALQFEAHASNTTTIAGTWTLTGASGNNITLNKRVGDAASQWRVDPQGTRSLSFVTVTDSNNTNATQINTAGGNITNGGNNTGWIFGIAISGIVYQTNETTPLGSREVALRVNGGAASTATSNAATGAFSFAAVATNAGDTLTFYLTGTEKGNVVTISDGSGAISEIKLIQNHVVIRADNGAAAITIPDLVDYDSSNDSPDGDMLFDAVDAASDTLTVNTGVELYIQTGTFTPGGNVDVDTGGIDIRGTWIATTTETINVAGNWVNTGTFTSATGTVIFDGGSTQTINAGGTGTGVDDTTKDFNNLTISGSTLQLIGSELEVDGTLTINSSKIVDLNGQALTAGTLDNNGTLRINGVEDVTITNKDLNSGKVLYKNGANVAIANNLSPYFDLEFDDEDGSTGGIAVYTWPASLLDVNGTLTITEGTLSMTNNANLQLGGSFTIGASGAFTKGTGTLRFDGTGTFTDNTAALQDLGTVSVNGSGITVTTATNMKVSSLIMTAGTLDISTNSKTLTSTGNLNVVGGTLTANNGDIDVDGDVTISSGTLTAPTAADDTSFTVVGTWQVTSTGTFTPGTGRVIFDATGVGPMQSIVTTSSNPDDFNDLKITGTGTASRYDISDDLTVNGTVTLTGGTMTPYSAVKLTTGALTISGGTLTATMGDLDVNGNITVSSGILTAPTAADDTSFTVAGNWSITGTGTFTPFTGRVIFDAGTTGKTITTTSSGTDDFYDVKFNNASGSWFLQDALETTHLTIVAGTLDVDSDGGGAGTTISNISVAGNWSYNGGTFNGRTGTVTFDTMGSVSTLSGATTFYNLTSITAGKVIKFPAGVTTTVSNTLTLNGQAPATRIQLCSFDDNDTCSGAGSIWNLVVSKDQGPFNFPIEQVRVKNSNATGSSASADGKIISRGTVDAGGNTNWKFGFTIKGRVFSGEGTGPVNGVHVNVMNSGVFDGNAGWSNPAVTDSNGAYTLSNINILAGNPLIIFVEPKPEDCSSGTLSGGTCNFSGSGFAKGTLMTVSDGQDKDCTNDSTTGNCMDIYLGRMIIRNSYATGGPQMTFTHFHQGFNGGSNYCDPNMLPAGVTSCTDFGSPPSTTSTNAQPYMGYRPMAGGGQQALMFESGLEVYIWPGTTFKPSLAAGQTVQFDAVDMRGTIQGSGETLTVKGNWDFASTGTFKPGGSPIVFSGTGTQTIAPGVASGTDNTFADVTFSGGGTYQFNGSNPMKVTGAFNVSSGRFVMDDDKDLEVQGNFTVAAGTTFTKSSGAGKLYLKKSCASPPCATTTIRLADNNATKQNLGKLVIGGTPDNVVLDTDTTAESVQVTSGNTLTTNGYDLTVTGSDGLVVSGTLDASGTTGGTTAIDVKGKVQIDSSTAFTAGSSTISISDTGTVNVTTSGASLANLTNASTGTVVLQDALTLSGGLTNSSTGTFNPNGKNITVAGDWNFSTGTYSHGSETVTLDGSAAQTLISTGNSFNNLTINKTGTGTADDINLQTKNLVVNGTLTVTDGELVQAQDVELTSKTVSIASAGAWTHTGGSASDNATITIGSGGVTNSGTITFNGLGGASTGGDADVVKIRSQTAGTQVQLKGTGTYTWRDVDVKDMIRMSPAIECYSCTNSGNNTNINFYQVVDHIRVQTSEPKTLSANSSINVSLQVYDNTGAVIVSGYSGEKTITFSGPTASPDGTNPTALDKTNTAVNFGTGTKLTFQCDATQGCFANTTLTLYKAESVSVDVTDGTYGSSGAATYDLDLTVSPLEALKLKFTTQPAPLTVTSTTDFTTQPVASIVDRYENIVTPDSTSQVTLAAVLSSDETTVVLGMLDIDTNPLTVASGSASFSGVNLKEMGTIKLKATSSPSLPSALSKEITVIKSASTILFTDINGAERQSYDIGENIYIKVTDSDENSSATAKQTVQVTVRNDATDDTEEVTLEETGVDTGIFMNLGSTKPNAALPSLHAVTGTLNNFFLETSSSGDIMTVTYVDNDDSDDVVDDSASFGSLRFQVAANVSGPVIAGASFDLVVTAVQGVGQAAQIVTNYQGTAALTVDYVSPTSGTKTILPAQVALSSGMAVVSVSYDDAGTIKIKAVDSTDSSLQGESSELVFVPASFEVTLANSMEQVNREFNMTITAKNLSGDTTPNYAGTVNLSAIPENDGLTSGTLFIPSVSSFSQGIAAVSNRYDSWGKVHFEAQDSVHSAAKGESASIQFIPKKLEVSLSPPPGSRAADNLYTYYNGESFTVTVKALDYLDQVVSNYGGMVNINNAGTLTMPAEHQFSPSEAGNYSFNVKADNDQAPFTLSAVDNEVSTVTGTSSPSAEVLTVQIIVESTYGGTGQAVSVTVKIVDSKGQVIKTDNQTVVKLVFYVAGKKLSEDSLLPSIVLPEVTTLEFINGVAQFNISSTKVETITVFAQPMGASPISETIPGTVNIGSIGQRGVRILSWAETRPPVKPAQS